MRIRVVVALAAVALAAYPLVSDDLYYQNMIILSEVFTRKVLDFLAVGETPATKQGG